MRTLAALSALVLASPAYAASGPFFSLGNTDFVVTLGFIGFILVYLFQGARHAGQDVGSAR